MTTHDTSRRSSRDAVIDLEAPRPAPDRDAGTVRTSSDRARDVVLAGATVLGPVLIAAGMLLEVDEGGDSASGTVMLDAIASNGSTQFWVSNFLASLGLVLLGAGGLTVMRLVRERGGALATVGGVLALIGGAAAAAGIFMYGAVASATTDGDLDRGAMGAMQDSLEDAWQVMPPFAIGFVGSTLALLLLAGALLRSRSAPVWVPVAVLVAGLLFFFTEGGPVGALVMVPLLAAYAFLAVRLLRDA